MRSRPPMAVQPAVTGPTSFDLYHSSNNVVRGIAFYNLRLAIDINGGAGNVIVGNFIGTNAAGTYHNTVTNSNTFGVVLEGQGADNNVIGRPNAADRNVLSGNSGRGLYTANFIHDNKIQNNIVGLNPAGTAQLANSDHGIDLNGGTTRTLVGGTGPMEGNLISGNDGHGIEISHSPTTVGNQILGNRIGTDPTGNSGPAYAQNGVRYGHEEGSHRGPRDRHGHRLQHHREHAHSAGSRSTASRTGTQIHDNKIGVSADGTSIRTVRTGSRSRRVHTTRSSARTTSSPTTRPGSGSRTATRTSAR